MLTFSVRREVVDNARRSSARPWSLIAHVGPYSALLHGFAELLLLRRTIKHPDWGIVRVEKITGHDIGLELFDQRS